MDKLNEIDQFMKFLPKLSNEAEKPLQKEKHNQTHKTKSKDKQNEQKQCPALSISQINQKVKEKINSFNTNSQKNSNVKKQRKSFKQPKSVNKTEKNNK
jgi:hypothetical protein